jgi:ubiquinone/menaquinone biosynthesis C-methylase UbiE
METEQLGSWHSDEYVAEWVGDDVIAEMLTLPRKISAALVADAGRGVEHVIDLGAGHGPYLELFLRTFPGARGTWLDYSEAMAELARERLADLGDRVHFVVADAERLGDVELDPADVIVSSRALHHFSPESLQDVYRACFRLTKPGGFVFNLDHVGAPGELEPAYRRVRDKFTGARRKPLKPHRHDYPLSRADQHLSWMEQAGYVDCDTPWRTLYTALLMARKPA